MYIDHAERNVETFGNPGTASKFTLSTVPKAIDQMINPYSDIIRAIIREYSTNAYDAHIASGKTDIGPKIVFPTMLDNMFRVRDYGPGMSYDFVMEKFTEIFYSTKDTKDKDPNQEYTGAIGRGRLAGFAYNTQTLMLRVYIDGHMMVYEAHRDENGVPTVVYYGYYDTDEPNGTEISIPVHEKDKNKFADRGRELLQYFKPEPYVYNLDYVKEPYLIEGEGWGIRNQPGSPRLIMGRIAYNLDDKHLGVNSNFYGQPIDVYFNLGELDFTESRESLRYHDWVIENIQHKFAKIKPDVIEKVSHIFDDCATYFEACQKMAREWKSRGIPAIIRETAKLNGRSINTKLFLTTTGKNLCLVDDHHLDECQSLPFNWKDHLDIFLDGSDIYFIKDTHSNKKRAKLRHNFQHLKNRRIVLIKDHEFDEVHDKSGNPPFYTWDDLEEPPQEPKANKAPAKPKRVRRLQLMDKHGQFKEEADKHVEDGGWYTLLYNGDAQPSINMNWFNGNRVLKLLHEANVLDSPIYGIPWSQKTIPNKRPQWVDIWPHIEGIVKQNLDPHALAEIDAYDEMFKDYKWLVRIFEDLVAYNHHPLPNESGYTFYRILEYYWSLHWQQQKNLREVARLPGLDCPKSASRPYDYYGHAYTLVKNKPMLKYVPYTRIPLEEEVDDVANYLNSNA